MWEECEEVVSEAWHANGNNEVGLVSVREKIKHCGSDLMAWGISKADQNNEEIKKLQKQLEILTETETTEGTKAKYFEVGKRLDDLLLKQEIYWAQRSRIPWLKYGDKNTKYFHSKASQKRRNHINGIQNGEGLWVEDMEDIVNVAAGYFDNLFYAGSCDQMKECIDAIPSKVTPEMQHMLSSDFTAEEVEVALFQMGPTKAPEPDGMNALFYQKFWHVVGEFVTMALIDFLNLGNMVPNINHTNIVLIPKVKNLEKMFDFRPISLCNVIYKIISKVLANRPK